MENLRPTSVRRAGSAPCADRVGGILGLGIGLSTTPTTSFLNKSQPVNHFGYPPCFFLFLFLPPLVLQSRVFFLVFFFFLFLFSLQGVVEKFPVLLLL